MISYVVAKVSTILITAAVTCPIPELSSTGPAFHPNDEKMVKLAQAGCKRRFGDNSCLLKLVKTGDQSYRAHCIEGKPKVDK